MTDSPLHVMITDPHLQGGGQVRYITTLAAGLSALGHRVTIGCRPNSVLVDHARGIAAPLDRFHFRGGLRPRSWLHDIREAKHFIREERPDILHVNGSQDHWTLALANYAAGRSVPLLRTRHNTYSVSTNWPNRAQSHAYRLPDRGLRYRPGIPGETSCFLRRTPVFDS